MNVHHPLTWWGERYGVTKRAIQKWLKLPDVLEIIEKETVSFSDMVIKKARKNVDMAMRELKKIAKGEKHTDVKRKACVDILQMAKVEKSKSSGIAEKASTKNYKSKSNKQLDEEYDELLGANSRKKKASSITETSADKTIN